MKNNRLWKAKELKEHKYQELNLQLQTIDIKIQLVFPMNP
jgi:hypothetical protein